MKNVHILVPVAPFEPLPVITRSAASLKALDSDGLKVDLTYVIDCPGGPDERCAYLNDEHIDHIIRLDTRGRRGGAINDGLAVLRRPDGTLDADYIAFFDVDSRPDPDFLVKSISVLSGDAFIASGARYIINNSDSWVTAVIDCEYSFFEDVYRLYRRFDGFMQFNGLIGVLEAGALDNTQLNEEVYCEDLELTQRLYRGGRRAVLAETRVGEQSPTTLKELYNQRVRWLSGALDGLGRNLACFHKASIPLNRKIAWFISVTIPFATVFMIPIVPAYGMRLRHKGRDGVPLKTLGLMFHVWFITFCGAVAILQRLNGKKVRWTDSSRSDI